MTQQKESIPLTTKILIWLQALLGFGAVVSGAMLMISPDGSLMHLPLNVIEGAPFKDFFIPGLIMFLLMGVFPSCIAYGLWKRPTWSWPNVINPFKSMHWSWTGSLVSGIIVSIWLSVELIWASIFILHYIYYAWSGLIILLSLLPSTRRFYQKH